ncbi:MAG: hypothetical protein Q8M16_07135 [Pirellulaceae bacterium]|nr:hypothetical protein [Pirellulaceae bacterium]
MPDSLTIYRLLKKDPRYPIEAYHFVQQGLSYATEILQFGQKRPNDNQKKLSQVHDLEQSSSDFQKEIEMLAGIFTSQEGDDATGEVDSPDREAIDDAESSFVVEAEAEAEGRHLSGQELCEALRQYALQQYGYMAASVLAQWGITATQDFGSIVYNLIDIGLMRKSTEDRQEHFSDVYDFQSVFVENFQFEKT